MLECEQLNILGTNALEEFDCTYNNLKSFVHFSFLKTYLNDSIFYVEMMLSTIVFKSLKKH